VVDLSLEFGIVTPYTSYLITEDDILSQEARDQAADAATSRIAAAPASGAEAVTQAQELQALADADSAAPLPMATFVTEEGEEVSAAEVLRYAGTRAFVLRDGVWTDTAYDPNDMETIEVTFASDDYFSLLHDQPELGPAFALGHQVVVVLDDTAYRVTAMT
jgi:Ca-activated chloride channel family protein